MEVLSVYRGARMSAFKVRELTREIQGLPASAALDVIAFSTKKASLFVGKTLKSAIANAENNNELKADTLVVKEATVGEGPTMKRMKSRARGSSSQIRKRTSHIRIVLTDEVEIVTRKPKTASKNKKRPPAPGTVALPVAKKPALKAADFGDEHKSVPAEPSAAETETPAVHASQNDEGPGETASAPKVSSDEDTTKD